MRPLPIGATLPFVWFPLLLTGCFWISETERDARWDQDGDGVERPIDCDDGDAALNERVLFYADADDDGYGNPDEATEACVAPEGFVADNTDCDDTQRAINPGASEICNQIDDDCDRRIDEDTAVIRFYRDADGDGAGDLEEVIEACLRPDGYVAVGDDCDDDNPDVYPSAPEVCNGIDDDCDDDIDLDDVDLDPEDATFYRDSDGDDFGRSDVTETTCEPSTGFVAAGGDCNDSDDTVFPGANERCNGRDDDCDTEIDEDAIDAVRSYPDTDGDGFGNAAFPTDSCTVPDGNVANGGDCDDQNELANPLADELCGTGENEDCDADIDEAECVEPVIDSGTTTTTAGDTGSTGDTGDTGP